jgi:hypothetical protein
VNFRSLEDEDNVLVIMVSCNEDGGYVSGGFWGLKDYFISWISRQSTMKKDMMLEKE